MSKTEIELLTNKLEIINSQLEIIATYLEVLASSFQRIEVSLLNDRRDNGQLKGMG